MVVDDDPGVRALCSALLSQWGHSVIQAHDGRHALDLLSSTPVDGVLLDIEMPGFRGDEVLAVLARERPSLPVVVMSSEDADVYRRVMALGAKAFIAKPFRARDLQAGLSRMLA
jgi:CheY-like chemotaxis protein